MDETPRPVKLTTYNGRDMYIEPVRLSHSFCAKVTWADKEAWFVAGVDELGNDYWQAEDGSKLSHDQLSKWCIAHVLGGGTA